MTAVDHAELKRLDEVLDRLEGPGLPSNMELGAIVVRRSDLSVVIGHLRTHAALLSEIEGLKAERDALSLRNVEAARLAYDWMVAHDSLKAGKPYDLPSPSRTQAPDGVEEWTSWLEHYDYAPKEIIAWLRSLLPQVTKTPATKGDCEPPQ